MTSIRNSTCCSRSTTGPSATRDIAAVYGETLAISVSPAPAACDGNPGFSVTIGESYTVTFALTERRRMGGIRWFVAVSVGSGGPGGSITPAGPERKNGQWTRSRLEDILLSPCSGRERAHSH
ncbi:hypothetical protein [Candidatus Amarobacter glycogenicus]|uniref:hypothetical protein n=1 Tax=Candidatus Amarobacter glycogenicus TaxID=3140699 RepID=UPI002A0F37C9|nr:hypothetical protein [Dehalococcoidia bacterium]